MLFFFVSEIRIRPNKRNGCKVNFFKADVKLLISPVMYTAPISALYSRVLDSAEKRNVLKRGAAKMISAGRYEISVCPNIKGSS